MVFVWIQELFPNKYTNLHQLPLYCNNKADDIYSLLFYNLNDACSISLLEADIVVSRTVSCPLSEDAHHELQCRLAIFS